MKRLFNQLHQRIGDLWWYSLMIFVACRAGDAIQAFIGLWLVPKYVGPGELGAVLPLQQLSGLFAVPLAVLATVFAKYVNVYATRGEYGKVKCLVRDVLAASAALFAVSIAAAYLTVPFFYERLRVVSGSLTVLVLAAGFATNIASIFTAALQGLKMFKTITVQNLIGAPIRLVTLLVAVPFRALSGYMLGQATPPAACSLLAFGSLRRRLAPHPYDTSWRKDLPEIGRYLVPVAAYTALGTLTGTAVATVVRQRLPEVESAAFYMLSRFSELAGYIALSMSTVLFPLASEAHEKGRSAFHLLVKTLMLTVAATLGILVVFHFAAPPAFARIAAWRAYAPYLPLLPWLTVFSCFGSTLAAFIAYATACRHFKTLNVTYALSCLACALLVCLSGHEFFRGILPDTALAWMASLHMRSLKTLTLFLTGVNVLQVAVFFACETLFYPMRASRSRT